MDVGPNNNNGKAVMSLAAQFDDLCRMTQAVYSFGQTEDEIIKVLKSVEGTRARAATLTAQAVQHLQRIRELESECKVKDNKLNNVRYALSKEIANRDKFQKERDALAKRLSLIRQLMLEDPSTNSTIASIPAKERLMSCLNNIPKLETLPEVSCDSSEQSLSGIEYDRTEEDILGLSRKSNGNRRSSVMKRASSPMMDDSPSKHNKKSRADLSFANLEIIEVAHANGPVVVTTSDDNRTESDKQGSVSPVISTHKTNRSLFQSLSAFAREPNKLPTVSTPTLPSVLTKVISSNGSSDAATSQSNSPTKVSKGHDFVSKFAFKPEPCYVCKKSAGGLLAKVNLLRCGNCMISIHPTCKDTASFPCIPVVQKQLNAKRGSRLTTIVDFVQPGQSMKIPSLIYHCCKEIERRGLVEPGLYRVPGNEKEVVELKNKILRSKNGMPALSTFDLHTLCCVVKKFLCSLDEPLVTRNLWRDFVEASQTNDSFEKFEQMKAAVNELPEVNRQTLAYLIVHLQKISDAPLCRMPRDNLSKIFGPTIVGQLHLHQGPGVPNLERMAVIGKQIAVMQMLLDSHVDFWKNLLTHEQQPVTNGQIPDSQPCSFTNSANSCPSNDRRASRAFPSGFVDAHGTLTPSKNAHSNYFAARQKVNRVKPLF